MYESNEFEKFADVIHFPCEVRILTSGTKHKDIYSGYFSNAKSMWESITGNTIEPKNVYFTINPVIPALLSRRCDRLPAVGRGESTRDTDIARIRSVVIDVDSVRPPGVPATEEEHQQAIEVAEAVRNDLMEYGFPEPVIVSSGNGAYVWFHSELDVSDSTEVVKPFLKAVGAKHNRQGQVEIDESVFNPARIMRVCGTKNMKGDSTSGLVVNGEAIPDRKHRMCRVLSRPEQMVPVSRNQFVEYVGLTNRPKVEAVAPVPSLAEKLGIDDCLPCLDTPSNQRDGVEWLTAWLERHGIEYSLRSDDGTWRKFRVECPFCGNQDSDVMVNLESGALAYKCFHQSAAACSTSKKWADFRSHFEPDAVPVDSADATGKREQRAANGGGKPNQLQQLLTLAMASFDFFPSRDGRCWAKTRVGLVTLVDSRPFHDELFSLYVNRFGKAASDKAMKDALSVLRVEAKKRPLQPVHKRVARIDDTIFIDLGSNGIARVSSSGWDVIPATETGVNFYRPSNSVELPLPLRGGSFEVLREVSGCSEEGFVLFRGAVLDAYKGREPYLLTAVTGEQGSAKSTLCRIYRRLVDPLDSAELSGIPRSEQDLCLDALNEHALVYDNVSNLPFWLSDALCRICTGGGFKTRALYTDNEQFVITTANPICMNGIPDFVTANDLVSRSLMIDQPAIEPDRRITDAEIDRRVRAAIPDALGGLLDMLVIGLRDESSVTIKDQPRMIDTARWVVACTGSHDFVDLLNECQTEALTQNSEGSPLCDAIHGLLVMQEVPSVEGRAADLLPMLKTFATDANQCLPENFPSTAKKLGNAIKREAPSLKQRGIKVTHRKTNGRRVIRLDLDQPSLSV